MKAKDAHGHLSKYKETALAFMYEQRSAEDIQAAVEAFVTECEVLDRAIPEVPVPGAGYSGSAAGSGTSGSSGSTAGAGSSRSAAGAGSAARAGSAAGAGSSGSAAGAGSAAGSGSAADDGEAEAPNTSDLAAFGEKIRAFNALDDEEKALRKLAALKKLEKQALAEHILKFMQKHGLDDVSTRCGTLRCVHRKSRCSLTRSAMAERIRSFFGDDSDSAEALRGNLFEGGEEREVVSLRRIVPRPPAVPSAPRDP